VSHQIGSVIAALGAGWIYSEFGDYYYAFISGAMMGLLAAGMAMMIRHDRVSVHHSANLQINIKLGVGCTAQARRLMGCPAISD
jgi:hypothetical protein